MRKVANPGPTFGEWVVRNALRIPPGRVTTYGRLARASGGGPMASQNITAILGRAAERGVQGIPFHRIVYADGRVWLDPAHREERLRLYAAEGIELDTDSKIKDFRAKLFEF